MTAQWLAFCDRELGYRPGTTAQDDARWAAFLERRHGTLARAAARHGVPARGRSPRGPPSCPPRRSRWPTGTTRAPSCSPPRASATASRCSCRSVRDELPDSPAVLERRAIAERVVAVQKPAHTVATVRLYWSAFRVGYARLGSDSALTDRPPRHHDAVLGRRALGDVVTGGPRGPLAGASSSLESDPCGCAPPRFRRNDG